MDHSLSVRTVEKVFAKLADIPVTDAGFSDYTMEYINRYKNESGFFTGAYSDFLDTVMKDSRKPPEELVFADYGGGCGILSFIAREAGFGRVIYADNFETVLIDAMKLGSLMNSAIDRFVTGEEKELSLCLKEINTRTALICSFDVIEHIYDHETWIRTIMKENDHRIFFHTSANPCNPLIRKRLRRIHEIAEKRGCNNNIRSGNHFTDESFLSERKKIIGRSFPGISGKKLEELAVMTRGLKEEKILETAKAFISNGYVIYKPDHETNTCDPYTGNWAERLLDLKRLKDFGRENGLRVRITASLYSYSDRIFLNFIKYLLNGLIRLSGRRFMTIAPAITIGIEKGDF